MTNTRIRDVEILESRYPGMMNLVGEECLMPEKEFMMKVTVLTERRVFKQYLTNLHISKNVCLSVSQPVCLSGALRSLETA